MKNISLLSGLILALLVGGACRRAVLPSAPRPTSTATDTPNIVQTVLAITPTITPTFTHTSTATPTVTPTFTFTVSATHSVTATYTPTIVYWVFTTSTTYTGNLAASGGGDSICQTRAAAGSLTGTYIAWLSTTSSNIIDRIPDQGSWKNRLGSLAFSSKSQLQSGVPPLSSIAYDESAAVATGSAWTGTTDFGFADPNRCTDWTSTGPTGMKGVVISLTDTWTFDTTSPCSSGNRIYCFQIAP